MPDKVDKITEQPSRFDHLEQMSVLELLRHINEEDCRVADAVRRAIPQIEALVKAVEDRMNRVDDFSISVQAPVVVWVYWMPASYLPLLVCLIRR